MKSLPRILKIIEVKPFKMTLLWDTGEERVVEFAPLFQNWEGDANLMKLTDWETFQEVSLSDTGALCWENVPVIFTYKGDTHVEPLELDSLVLYRQSKKIAKNENVTLGRLDKLASEKMKTQTFAGKVSSQYSKDSIVNKYTVKKKEKFVTRKSDNLVKGDHYTTKKSRKKVKKEI